jgi:hypothetical protein
LPEQLSEISTGTPHEGNGRAAVLKPVLVLNAEIGYYLGVMAGDGWCTDKDVVFAGITSEIVDKMDSIVTSLFDAAGPTRCTVESELSYGESRRHTYTAVALAKWTKPLIGSGARRKHLPPFFLAGPEEFRLGLLAGLMDTDGSISVSSGKAKKQLMANFYSTSLRLVQEVQLLAASLGISSRVTNTTTPAGRAAWMLSLSNADVKRWNGRYMVHPSKLAALAATTVDESSPAYVRTDIIPVPTELASALADLVYKAGDIPLSTPEQRTRYATCRKACTTGYMTRAAAIKVLELAPAATDIPGVSEWLDVVKNTDITWDQVVEVDRTGQLETGYDLTVPGSETFVSAAGVILSNTASYSVPVSEKAVAEAKAKMLPSANLLNASRFDVHYVPKNEYQLGLYQASVRNNGKAPQVFRSKADVIAAYRRGELRVGDPVTVLEK